jgi:RNA recognition motif-containing protein
MAFFCRNLSWATTNEMLAAHFERLGCTDVAASVVRFTDGRSKGFATVTVAAGYADLVLDPDVTHEVDGRRLQVRADRGATKRRAAAVVPSDTLHVENLAWETTDEALHAFFMQYGEPVSATVEVHPDTGRSKGWGLVAFASAEAATSALADATASETPSSLDERPIRIKFDRPQRAVRVVGIAAPVDGGECSLVVGNLPWSAADEDVAAIVASHAAVLTCVVAYGHDGRSRGYARVTTATAEGALRATQALRGFQIEGRAVSVAFDKLGRADDI